MSGSPAPAMKTIGVIGGIGWASSALYYRIVNQEVRARRGDLHAARVLLDSLDHFEIVAAQRRDDWDDVAAQLIASAERLERGGADFLLIACNTVHAVADAVEQAASRPFLHIADAAGQGLAAAGCRRVGLLGTANTMKATFYPDRLRDRHGIEVVLPSEADRERVHAAIFDELVHDRVTAPTAQLVADVIGRLEGEGADGVLLACTELGLLLGGPEEPGLLGETPIPVFDTTELHAKAAVDWALADLAASGAG